MTEERNLINRMNELISEAHEKGFTFTFESGKVHFTNADTAFIFSNEEDFDVGLWRDEE